MTDHYLVTDGATTATFESTPGGLWKAWRHCEGLRGGGISNPNRVDEDCPDGLTEEDQDLLDLFEVELDDAIRAGFHENGYEGAVDAVCDYLEVTVLPAWANCRIATIAADLEDRDAAAYDRHIDQLIDEARGK